MEGTQASAAVWFAPLVLPVCLYVAWSDLATMKIPNRAVIALVAIFALLGPFLLPLDVYLWRWAQLVAVLLLGMVLNAAGAMGAGDAKFLAAAAAFVPASETGGVLMLLALATLAAFAVHRGARATPLRRLAPGWESWSAGNRFPMGFPFAATLGLYLLAAALGSFGS